MNEKEKIAIVGAGPMGLTLAYLLAKNGYAPEVFESENVPGGMSAHFNFSGTDIEKYYHFVCGSDQWTFALMKELGIYENLKWTDTKMGFFYKGRLYDWGGPIELLSFPKASLVEKARYGTHIFLASKFKDWRKLDDKTAIQWIKKWEGETGYEKFWESLFGLKFYELKDKISAPWLWSRLARTAKSRKNIFQERMGYISGGSRVLIDALIKEINERGGKLRLSKKVEGIAIENGRAKGLYSGGEFFPFDKIVSTIPLNYLAEIVPNMPASDAKKLKGQDNVGVVCVVMKLKKTLTKNFWLNINDENMDIPGVIEISNLNVELSEHIVYLPFYLHKNSAKYQDGDDIFKDKATKYVSLINENINAPDIKDIKVFRYEYAQPVTGVNFRETLPPMQSTERNGFYFADTAYSYPEDRSINESVKIAHELSDIVQGEK